MKKTIILFALMLISLAGFCDKFVWNQKANYPSFPRHRCAAFSIGNKGYMGIGHINSGLISDDYHDWWEFDPATNSWTQKADYPVDRYGTATFVIGNKGYMGTGQKQGAPDQKEFYQYDPISNIWTQKADFPMTSAGNLGFAINGMGYMGISSGTGLYRYDPTLDTWTAISTPITSSDYGSIFVIANKAYIVPAYSSALYMFDPITGLTTNKAPFIGPIRYGSSSFTLKGQGYIGLGDYLTSYKDFYFYEPSTDIWDTIPKAFPGVRRFYAPSFVIGDNAYFGTGTNGTNLGDMWAYEWKISVGINEINTDNTISIYPNPTSDFLNFKIANTNSPLTFKLFSLSGKAIFNIEINQSLLSCDVSSIADGIYIATIFDENDNLLFSKQLIIN
jgi:N-acetylneuraminic acid mutarotase